MSSNKLMDQPRDSSRFEAALEEADRGCNLILIAVLGVTLIVAFLYELSPFKRPLVDFALGGVLVASLIGLAVLVAKEKNRIARKFGLKCQSCNHLTLAIAAVDAFRSGACPNCGTDYPAEAKTADAG